MAAIAVVLGTGLIVCLSALCFLCGYLYRGDGEKPSPLVMPRISLGRSKQKKTPKYMNEEQLAARELAAQGRRGVSMTEQEAADLGGG